MPMAKETEKKSIELKPVDEEAEKVSRFVRLHPDAVEEVVELPPVRVGAMDTPEARLMAATREELKTRSNEPHVGSLIEREEIREEDQWNAAPAARSRIPWGWVALLGCVFSGAILWSLMQVGGAKDKRVRIEGAAKHTLEKEMQEDMDAVLMVDAIETTVRAFFDSRTVEEMRRYVRQPDRVEPLMERHYLDSPPVPVRVERMAGLEPLTIENLATFWMVSCVFPGGGKSQVLVEVLSAGEAKVDWETFVCYQPMDWDEFAKGRPGGYTGDFRVYVEPDNYYSFEFADSATYASFRLTALGGEETLYGYVARGTELEARMNEAIGHNRGAATPMMLRLHLPGGVLSRRGVVVREMVAPRWIFLEDPEKDKP
ncbi:hypothetical protein HZ994_06010 [Akkermansiaceae bacterium]|nr:hypothetical protein HZ994_06010 [Akkermansiaceae bacterium]